MSLFFRGAGIALLLMAGVPSAVTSAPASTRSACPNVGLRVKPVVLTTSKGRFRYDLEIAASPSEQECGLMFRKVMKRSTGMFFPFDQPKSASFWMENTPLSLDLIFVTPDSRVLSVASNAKPMSRMIIDSRGVAASVIELNAGEAARIGLKAGDRVDL